MNENPNTVHQDGNEEEFTLDLSQYEDDDLPGEDDLEEEDLADGQEPKTELPELEYDPNWTEEERKERWDQQVKGIEKLKKRAEESVAKAKFYLDNEQSITTMMSYAQAFDNNQHALPALSQLVGSLKKAHNLSDADVAAALGFTKAQEDEPDYDVMDNAELYRKAKEDAIKELEGRFGSKLNDIEKIEREREERRKFSDNLERNYPTIVKKVSELAGVRINLSKSQVEKALLAEPEVAKKDPAKAVWLHHSALIKKVMAKNARSEGKGPEMVKSSPRSGQGKKPVNEMSFTELARHHGVDAESYLKNLFE